MPWTKDHDAWVRLGAAIRAERERQGMLQEDLADRAGGVSVGTVRNAETGRVPKGVRWPQSLTQIEKVLGWGVGSMQEILRGGEPIAPSQVELRTEEPTPEPEPEKAAPKPQFITGGWISEHGRPALQEALPHARQLVYLCGLLGASDERVDAYSQALRELLEEVYAEQGWSDQEGK
ncbi:helix-turn-helix domain-containing protein [Streptomyces sp. NPDC087437]|uniref:helix-turn-helix domain-containing protein n=1 Tax=Streptomyces sp. NPDC087437 TaxID=3365789 RepID=UPI0037F1AC26